MRIKSLSDKIVLYFVIIGVTAIAIVSTYSFYTSKNALLNRTFNQLTSVRVVKKNQVEQFFIDRLNDFELIASASGISQINEDGIISNTELQKNSFCQLFDHLSTGGYYKGVYIELEDSTLVYLDISSPGEYKLNIAEEKDKLILIECFNNSDQTIIHDYLLDTESKQPRMFISGHTATIGKFSGQNIGVEISIDAINKIMLKQNPNDGLGLTGESYIVGNDKLMRSNSRFQKNSLMQTIVSTNGVENAFKNITGTSVIMDYRQIKVLSSYSKLNIPGLNWVILAEIDYSEATKSIYFIRNNILLLTIIVSFIVFIFSLIFSKRITLPLIKLTDATANIQSGNLDIELPKTEADEIGQLTNSFQNMTESLKIKDKQLMEERNKRITAMIDGQELERQRLSRELHDGLGQSLIALKLKLETIRGKDVCSINKTVKEVKHSFDGTINEIRRISNDLMPAVLSEFGLVTALKNICEDISDNSNIDLQCIYKGNFNNLDDKTAIYLFRIIQEALNNIVKHADTKAAEVRLKQEKGRIFIWINDNGKGLVSDRNISNAGNGIPNIRERVRLLNGIIDFKSQAGKGTQIYIEIPINKK